ncbi:MAG TPA: ATP-binding protein [Solirubrobacteraceae bacterium]|nr:ATP-binding protein [Solirubrobacteraceae bacterium]
MSHPTIEQLRTVDLFDGLSEEDLEPWAQAAQVRDLTPGTPVSEQGKPSPAFHLVLSGSLETFSIDPEGRAERVGEQLAPTWVGAIAVLTGGVSGVRMVASSDVTLAAIEPEEFIQLTLAQRVVFDRVMAQVRPVVSRINAVESDRERLAGLGTMAAGLAHELNNPASAARRAASDLAEALGVLASTIGHFVESGVEREEAQQLVELQRQALSQCAAHSVLEALDAADAEDALREAIEDLCVEEAWKLSEPLSLAGVDAAWLARVNQLAGAATPAALRWVAASLTAQTLAAELTESTGRMSALVGAVKQYAYMDRGDLVETDIHEGLETTLTVLSHKLKHTRIEVVREYDRTLPKLTLNGGELNQVWTNLLDNAIQALGEKGTITISTSREGPCVRVDIADDGPGIAPEVRERIFEPFFTTKDVGQGTGLGLDTARRIVRERNRGSIDVTSEPRRTVFHVRLPVQSVATSTGADASAIASVLPSPQASEGGPAA